MLCKTAALTGDPLNWAVAVAEGLTPYFNYIPEKHAMHLGVWVGKDYSMIPFNPGIYWGDGGPIIDRAGIATGRTRDGKGYAAWIGCASDYGMVKFYTAPTLLIAAMRCYVAFKLGNAVEIPDSVLD